MTRFLWRWFGYEPRDLFWLAVLVALFLACAITPRCASGAEPVTPSLVCGVQHALKLHATPAWVRPRCEEVAAALNDTREPLVTLAVAANESDMRAAALAHVGHGVYDVGLVGVRCVLAGSRCTNGQARGRTLTELRDPVVNVQVGAAIMEEKRARHGHRWLRHYNGGTREHGYALRIQALVAALGGRLVKIKWPRTQKQCRQIVAAVAAEGKT